MSSEQMQSFETIIVQFVHNMDLDVEHIPMDQLAIHVHRILRGFLAARPKITKQVDHYVEQALAILMVSLQNVIRGARFLTNTCTKLQRALFSIHLHCAVLDGKDYSQITVYLRIKRGSDMMITMRTRRMRILTSLMLRMKQKP